LGVAVIDGVGVSGFEERPVGLAILLADGREVAARLLVAADGVKSRLRDIAAIKTVKWEYGQSGIVCTVRHERPHNGRAEEHFLPAGPFAILPLPPGPGRAKTVLLRSCGTERTADATRLVDADELVFDHELEMRFGLKLGERSGLKQNPAHGRWV
jgi:2-octaprenyl-6-methoxyphenol hydroxylase